MLLVRDIQRTVAMHYGFTPAMMREPAPQKTGRIGFNTRDKTRARQVAMCLSMRLTEKGPVRIGRLFGNRDHTTVLYGDRKATKRDPETLRILTIELLRGMGR